MRALSLPPAAPSPKKGIRKFSLGRNRGRRLRSCAHREQGLRGRAATAGRGGGEVRVPPSRGASFVLRPRLRSLRAAGWRGGRVASGRVAEVGVRIAARGGPPGGTYRALGRLHLQGVSHGRVPGARLPPRAPRGRRVNPLERGSTCQVRCRERRESSITAWARSAIPEVSTPSKEAAARGAPRARTVTRDTPLVPATQVATALNYPFNSVFKNLLLT